MSGRSFLRLLSLNFRYRRSFLRETGPEEAGLEVPFREIRVSRISVEGRESRPISRQRIPFRLQLDKFGQHLFGFLDFPLLAERGGEQQGVVPKPSICRGARFPEKVDRLIDVPEAQVSDDETRIKKLGILSLRIEAVTLFELGQ